MKVSNNTGSATDGGSTAEQPVGGEAAAQNDTGGATTQPPVTDSAAGATAATGGAAATEKADQPQGITLNGKDDTDTDGEHDEGGDGGGGDGAGADEGGEDTPFTYPEGFKGDPAAEASLREFAKEKNLSPEDQQRLADIHSQSVQAMNAAAMQEVADIKQAWRQELRDDPEFGGGNLKQTGKDANWVLKTFMPELVADLPLWNLDENPNLIRGLARIKRAFKENTSPKGGNPAQAKPKTLADSKQEMLDREAAKARQL